MKKIIFFIIIVLVAGWVLQNYTSFKAIDYAKDYWQKIDWSKLNIFSDDKATADPEKQLNIFIRDGKFVPNLSAVNAGIKITWLNEDTKAHTITGEGWGSGEIAPNKAYSKTFDVAGDYKYHCSLYPSLTGEIIVR
ncbi:MAG TPA: cupredoxin domain-containing protein [Candidatus Portnoybacteria bacterium]|nr:cupredoxin domain-containing protein [Candidatus Portnoybacteria bacterium]